MMRPNLLLLRHAIAPFLCLGLAGCGLFGGKEEPPPADAFYFTAQVNGEPWEAEEFMLGFGCRDDDPLLSGSGTNLSSQYYPYRETLGLHTLFRGTGTYSLDVSPNEDLYGIGYTELDGDAMITSYSASGGASANWLRVTAYDSARALMEGAFATVQVIDPDQAQTEPGEPPRRQPDTLRFADGRFRVEVQDFRERLGCLDE